MNDQNQEMLENQEALTRMVEPDAPKMGAVQRVINIFISPGELMQNIKLYPVVLVPFIVSVIIGLASLPVVGQVQDIMMQELSNISIERYGFDMMGFAGQADIYGDLDMDAIMDATTMVMGIAGAVFTPLIIGFLAALGLWILSKICKGGATLGQMFSMQMHIYIFVAVASLISSFLMVSTGRFLDMTSLAAVMMPDGNISMVMFNVLSAISIFNIWTVILNFVGVKIINGFSNVKAGVIAFVYFLATTVIYVGITMSTFFFWDMAMGM